MANPIPSKVRVVLRVRPFLPSEVESREKSSVPWIEVLNPGRGAGEEVTVHLKDQWTSRNERYKLDSFFGQDGCVGQIFRQEVSALIPGIFQGLNATVFAYGATGSGKTYTMQGTEDEPGLIPLAISTVLSLCEHTDRTVEISYYEVYLDRCYDLLEPKVKEIVALDDKEGKVQLKGLSWVQVRSMGEFRHVFSTGIQRRKVAHTGLNDLSSRSHAVLAISIKGGAVKGKLNLIDLAGNEDNRKTCNEGIRLQESAKINQSLFALSNVIHALNNNEPRIPYRESKLTRILQDSLGGTSRALMIACLNPVSYQEAVHTVSLAARSRQVVKYVDSASKETPKVRVDMEEKLRAWLESKGKKNSIQRTTRPFSPVMGRTPTPINHSKKAGSVCSSAIGIPRTNGRKLFDLWPLAPARMESIPSSGPPAKDQASPSENDLTQISKETSCEDLKNAMRNENQNLHSYEESNQEEMDNDLLNFSRSLYQDDTSDRCKNPQNSNNHLETPTASSMCFRESNHSGGQTSAIRNKSCTALDFPGSNLSKENKHVPSAIVVRSPETNERTKEQNSLQKVLSPLSSNHLSSEDRICVILLDPKTPKRINDKDDMQVHDTPLDKFNASSSTLKESLVQEYLTFLNIASKEELMQLKGIGQKRAEYILELREHTPKPLKSLSDLEKIGLSSKQVQDMFRRAARRIFE